MVLPAERLAERTGSGWPNSKARSFLLDSLDDLVILDTDPGLRDETWRMLNRLRGARLTYVAASSLALMARHGIRAVWATDQHLGLTGAEVLPRSH